MPAFEFKMRAKVWLYPGPGGWHFVTLPKKQSAEIRALFGAGRAWGAVPVIATIGNTGWKTSIFIDKQRGAYLLPIKADVRKREHIALDQTIQFTVRITP